MLQRLLHGTIRKKLAILFLTAALPSILIITATSLHNRELAMHAAQEELLGISRHLADFQNQGTRGIKALLEVLAELPTVRRMDPEACSQLFANVLKVNQLYGVLQLVDPQGNLVASATPHTTANFAHTLHFRDALASKTFATGEFTLDPTLGIPVFAYAYPVLDESRLVQAVLLASIRLDRFGEIFLHQRFPEHSFISLCDRNGIRLFRFPENPRAPVGQPVTKTLFNAANSDKAEGILSESGTDAMERLHAYQQLRLAPEQKPYMFLFIGEPRQSVYASARTQMHSDFRTLFLAIGLTLASGWFLGGRTMGRRFEELAAAAGRIGEGDLSARVRPAPDITEVDVLARAFNNMAESLSRDIISREKAEAALRESEHRHKIIFQNSPLGMVFFDSEGTIVDCNPPFEALMGSSREKLIGFNTARQSSPKMRETIARALGGEIAVFEDAYTSITGGLHKDLRVVFNPISPGTSPTGVIATLEDIGERKQAEKALQESEARFRKLVEHVPNVAVQGYDENGVTRFWNLASEALYGYSPGEAVGRSLLELIIPPEMRDEVATAIRTMIETGQSIPSGELALMRKDGSRVPVYSSHAIVEKPDGARELFCIDVDLSIIKKAEADLLRAKEDAEAANRAKSEFLANMSHEIRTPINGVLGMLQLMETTVMDDEQRQYVELATTSVNRLNCLLSDILDLSRVEAGKMVIRQAPFRVRDLCESVLGLFAVTARNKGIMLGCSLDAALAEHLVGDETRVRQILFNLVGNALKFTEQGGIDIEISLAGPGAEDGSRVLFSVTDTGIGIPGEQLKDIFEPFRQVENTFTRNYQGAGLGLAIVHRLVRAMGGSIEVESEPGQGTAVHVLLPFGKAPGPEDGTAPKARGIAERKGSLRILLVEDDPSNQFPLMKFLEFAGHETTLAENGRKALDTLASRDFDLILMDIQMPVMDGAEATRIIRSSENLGDKRHIPIIALTAYAMDGDRERLLAMGMNAYLAKPVQMEDLLRTIDNLTRG